MAGKLRYAYLDEAPVVFDDHHAYEFVGGRWRELNVSDAQHKAGLLTKAEFDSYAAGVPDLPVSAFLA